MEFKLLIFLKSYICLQQPKTNVDTFFELFYDPIVVIFLHIQENILALNTLQLFKIVIRFYTLVGIFLVRS